MTPKILDRSDSALVTLLPEMTDAPRYLFWQTPEGPYQLVPIKDDKDLEEWMETIEILNDPETMAAIEEGLADIEAGRVHTHEEVFAELNT